MDDAVKKATYYDFIEVMPPALYEPMIAKEQFKNIVEIEETIKQLIEVGRRAGLPVFGDGNVHYIDPEEEIYREIIVRALGQGAPINWTIGNGENAQPSSTA